MSREELLEEIFLEENFNVVEFQDQYELEIYTPAREDWIFYLDKLEDIIPYAKNFNPEEEFNLWCKARIESPDYGVPEPVILYKDQFWKKRLLKKLAHKVVKALKEGEVK